MKIVSIIPARYQSSRFPGKPLADICGKPMIWWVYNGIVNCKKIDAVYVATDDLRIYDTVINFGGKALMTSSTHISGSDRLAECLDILQLNAEDIVLNIQGDEPLINLEIVNDLLNTMTENVVMGTLKHKILQKEDLDNPNIVKVITDNNDNALYFSRSTIPYNRNSSIEYNYYRHLGLYAYKAGFLRKFTTLPKGTLEQIESLEQLRVLENGYKIKVKETSVKTFGVDIPEDIKDVEKVLVNTGRN